MTTGPRLRAAAALVLGMAVPVFLWAIPAVSVPGLVGYWRLDEAASPAADDSGSANPGTWQGGPVASSAVPSAGPPGIGFANPNCLSFDGVDDFVNLGAPAALNLANAISVAAWVNVNSTTTEKKVVAKWQDTPAGDFSYLLTIYPASTGNPARFVVQTAASGMQAAISPTAINVGTWYHLVGTYDGTTVRMYVNGTAGSTAAATGPITLGGAPVRIGAGSGTTIAQEEPFPGRIDDVRIYNYAISPAEVTTLYNGQLPSPAPTLTATGQTAQVALSWTSSTGGTSYNVRRGSAAGGPYGVLANVAGTAYTDTAVTVGTTYYYQIGAVNIVGEALSAVQPATPTAGGAGSSSGDSEEGLRDGKCACGTSIAAPGAGLPGAAAVAAFLLAFLRRPR